MDNDLISRGAVLAIIDEKSYDTEYPSERDELVGKIERLPALDAVPVVHGHWIHDINNLYGCSECRARETMSHKKKKNCCPNCGARMDAEGDR